MDLAALAKYLETKPEHPLNRQPLDASNIRNYAFRIG
jgi:effector protein HopAB